MAARAWDSTVVEPMGDGRYRATIGDEWVLVMVPQGGIVSAVAARAMAVELGTDQPLRSIHGVFVRPVPSGPIEAHVTVLRRGRSVSQARVDICAADGEVGYSAVGVFGGDRTGFSFTELAYPDEVPDPDDCPSFRDPPPPEAGDEWLRVDGPLPFWAEVLDGRGGIGHAPWDDTPRGAAEVANWFKFDDTPVLADGLMDPLALLVMADVMPGAVFEKLGPRESGWFAPSVDLSLHLFGHATPGWILAHAKAHLAGDGYASAEMALWDPRGADGPTLVAWAAQQMFFTRVT
ncbi:thioesterase family protein [Aquihabitans sp. McL0605]|uniref:thioesterase family protein n=1 Tax=Aquihabitans sp. McL0605 TaxID=3415671 RepID=UPI003CF2D16D